MGEGLWKLGASHCGMCTLSKGHHPYVCRHLKRLILKCVGVGTMLIKGTVYNGNQKPTVPLNKA